MPATDKLRVVIDTNIFISAMIAAAGLPAKLIRLWKKNRFTLVVSNDTIEEITEVLHREEIEEEYNLSPHEIFHLATSLKLGAEIVSPLPISDLPIHCRDAKDDFLLALAFAAGADYLITGDKDLLALKGNKKLSRLEIVTVKEFINLIAARPATYP
jgi:putative PIN family toxin of toxin-antitoxin system